MAFLLARYLIGDFVSGLLRGKSRKWDMVSVQLRTFITLLFVHPLWCCPLLGAHDHAWCTSRSTLSLAKASWQQT